MKKTDYETGNVLFYMFFVTKPSKGFSEQNRTEEERGREGGRERVRGMGGVRVREGGCQKVAAVMTDVLAD